MITFILVCLFFSVGVQVGARFYSEIRDANAKIYDRLKARFNKP